MDIISDSASLLASGVGLVILAAIGAIAVGIGPVMVGTAIVRTFRPVEDDMPVLVLYILGILYTAITVGFVTRYVL